MTCPGGAPCRFRRFLAKNGTVWRNFGLNFFQKDQKISKKSSVTLKIGKEAFYKQLDMKLSDAYDYASKVMVQNMLKLDAKEGIDAFIDKREPNWKDK